MMMIQCQEIRKKREINIPTKIWNQFTSFCWQNMFFSPLIPGKKYDLDMENFRKTVVAKCPGNCEERSRNHTKTHTGIGHKDVWHGYIDIYLNNQVPVKMVGGTETDAIVLNPNGEERANEEASVETHDDTMIETETMETEQKVCYESNVLEQKNVIAQTAAQTVVNSFIQAKDTIGFIPTICTTLGVFMIYLYDSINDIFLLSEQVAFIINEDFVDDVIIILWMILNYDYFLVKPQRLEEIGDVKSNFETEARDKISIYKNQLKKMVHFSLEKHEIMLPVGKQYLQLKLKSR